MPILISLDQELNQAVSGIHQRQDPAKRRVTAEALIQHLEQKITELSNIVRNVTE